jgi:hypothetical protein
VVQTNELWTRITINYRDGIPAGANSAEAVMVWLSRAGQMRPLDITFFVPNELGTGRETAQSSDGSSISEEEEEDEEEEMSENDSNADEEEPVQADIAGQSVIPEEDGAADEEISEEEGDDHEEMFEDDSNTDEEEQVQAVGHPLRWSVIFCGPETYDPRMVKTVDVLAPSYKRWRTLVCSMPDSLIARLFPFVRHGRFAISADSSSPPFDLPVLETLEISVSHGLSKPWVGCPALILQPFTASPALTSVMIPSHSTSLLVGVMPWSQLRILHVNSPYRHPLNCSVLEFNQALAQCRQLEELVLNLQTVRHSADPNALLPVITPRQVLPSLRVMTLVLCPCSYIGHMHLVGSIIAPSLEILSLSGEKELKEHQLNILSQSDEVETNIPEQHRTLCRSVTAFLQASDTRLTTLHFSVFYADADSICGLFNAAADTLAMVSFRHGRPVVLAGMHNVPTSPLTSGFRWTVDPDESARRNDDLAKLVKVEKFPKVAFRRIRVFENDTVASLE